MLMPVFVCADGLLIGGEENAAHSFHLQPVHEIDKKIIRLYETPIT